MAGQPGGAFDVPAPCPPPPIHRRRRWLYRVLLLITAAAGLWLVGSLGHPTAADAAPSQPAPSQPAPRLLQPVLQPVAAIVRAATGSLPVGGGTAGSTQPATGGQPASAAGAHGAPSTPAGAALGTTAGAALGTVTGLVSTVQQTLSGTVSTVNQLIEPVSGVLQPIAAGPPIATAPLAPIASLPLPLPTSSVAGSAAALLPVASRDRATQLAGFTPAGPLAADSLVAALAAPVSLAASHPATGLPSRPRLGSSPAPAPGPVPAPAPNPAPAPSPGSATAGADGMALDFATLDSNGSIRNQLRLVGIGRQESPAPRDRASAPSVSPD